LQIGGGQAVEGRQLHQLHTPNVQESGASNEKGVRPLPVVPCKRFFDLTSSVRLEHLQLPKPTKGGVVRHSKIVPPNDALGHFRQIGLLATLAECPLCPPKATRLMRHGKNI